MSNGSATWTNAGNITATIQASDKTVLVWNGGAFSIAAGETFNFTLPSGGAILNKVGYSTSGADNAVIDGSLFSTGRVFVLANGNISVGDGATVTALGGIVLTTLQETSDFSFTTQGNLTFTGNSTGNITIGSNSILAAPQFNANLEAWAGAVVSNRAVITGDAIFKSVTANQAMDVSTTGNLSVSGNFTAITNNGAISGTNPVLIGSATGNQTATFTTGASGNASVILNNTTNDFEIIAVNAPGTNGSVTIRDANIVTLSNSTVGGALDVLVQGNSTQTGIATNGVVAVTGNSSFETVSTNSAISIGNNSTLGGIVTATTNNSTISIVTAGNLTAGAVNSGNGTRTAITLTATNSTLTLDGAVQSIVDNSTTANINLTGASITQTANGTISLTTGNNSVVAYNATNGGITIGGTVSAPRVTANSASANGAITQNAVITTTRAASTSSFNSGSGNITLNSANSFIAGQTVQLSGGTVALTNINNTVIGTTNTTGNLSLTLPTAGSTLALGTGSGTDSQNITVTGVLAATTNGGDITDGNYTAFNIFGGMNLTTAGGNVTLDAATANGGLAPNIQFGAVNINAGAGAVSVAETTALNLGNISATNTLNARSVTGGIVDSGTLTISGGTPLANFTVSAMESVVLDASGHTLGSVNVIGGTDHSLALGTLTRLGNATAVPGNLTITTPTGQGVILGDTAGGSVAVGNLTVNSGGTILVDGGVAVTGTANLVSADTSATSINDTTTTGRLQVMGVATLASSGGISLDVGHDFSSVVLNGVSGNTVVRDINNVTISGNATGAVEVRAGNGTGAIAAPWSLVLGNLNAGSLNAFAQDAGGGISGTITQASGSSMHIENDASFTTDDANIIIGNNGNSFGRVALNTGASSSRTVTIVEDGTLKLGNLNSRGSTSITSRFGSIIEDAGNNTRITNNGTLTLNAVSGSVLIGNTTRTAGAQDGNVTAAVINAPTGAAAIISNNTITLGNVNANSLTVTTTGGVGNIAQSGNIKTFSSAAFVAAGNVVLSNTTNNFGRVSLSTTRQASNITLTEGGTLNLGTVTQNSIVGNTSTGTVTLTSVNGDIIDTGLAGVRPGGTIAASGNGVVTLAALNGNIVLDDPTTDFPTTAGVVFNAQNVTLSPLGQATLVLGSANLASVAGNLTATSSLGNITNAGDLNIAGAAWFQTPNNIVLNQSGNRFGTLRFSGNQVSISQVNDMNIVRGSTAIGQAALASTGSYITIAPDGAGTVTFGNTVSLSASSSITLPDFFQAAGQLTVNAAGTKDLSALSISGDLGGLTPVNLGTGTYVAPQP